MRAFFLYTELAEYTMACFRKHVELHPNDEIHVVHYPVNSEAPFHLSASNKVFLYNKIEYELADIWELFERIQPDVVLCSGWNDKGYNKLVKMASKLVPVILCFDNYFRYSLKQIVGIPIARILFRGVYSGVWVPGKRQSDYARLLGFDAVRIFTGFYSTDINTYKRMWEADAEIKRKAFPKIFLCVARYIPQKGLNYLWQAFAELCSEMEHPWELWCAGAGEEFDARMQHDRIKHLGFVQPSNYSELISKSGVFVLPSLFEPWGVVVNEFAAAGFPMLLSEKVGSASVFLEQGENGFSFKPGNVKAIKEVLRRIILSSDTSLFEMAEKSANKGEVCSAEKWSESLISMSRLTD